MRPIRPGDDLMSVHKLTVSLPRDWDHWAECEEAAWGRVRSQALEPNWDVESEHPAHGTRVRARERREACLKLLLDGPQTATRIASLLGMTPGGAWHMLHKLEDLGLVKHEESKETRSSARAKRSRVEFPRYLWRLK